MYVCGRHEFGIIVVRLYDEDDDDRFELAGIGIIGIGIVVVRWWWYYYLIDIIIVLVFVVCANFCVQVLVLAILLVSQLVGLKSLLVFVN
jgi:hypothetical protein